MLLSNSEEVKELRFYSSQIPESVMDKSSPVYNKGRVWINDGNPAVAEEFSKVSKANLKSFFTYREMEMVPGGLLFVMMMSRRDSKRKEVQFGQPLGTSSPISGMFELAWNDLVAEVTTSPSHLHVFAVHSINNSIFADVGCTP